MICTKFSLDRGDLWDTRLIPGTQAADYTYENLIGWVKMGNHDEIKRIFQALRSILPLQKYPQVD